MSTSKDDLAIMIEHMDDRFNAVIEILSPLQKDVATLKTDVAELKSDMHVIKAVLKNYSGHIDDHETRLTRLESQAA